MPGASDAWATPGEPRHPTAALAPVWDAYADVLRWPPLNSAPFASRGHQPEQQVDVRVSEESRASYSALVTDTVFPEGALLAELPHAPGGPGYVMRKVSGSWSFTELDGSGRVLFSGALALCLGCHTQAPSDGVFGLARPP